MTRDPHTGRFTTSTETPFFDAVAGPHTAHVEALLTRPSLPADAAGLAAALEQETDRWDDPDAVKRGLT